MEKADIGLIGLAVMGQNLALNIADHGFKIAVYNRSRHKTDEFLANTAQGKPVFGTFELAEFCNRLSTPRRIMLMVKAGAPVDALIEQLVPLLSPGDIIIDGGNSLYSDTDRRVKSLTEKSIHFVGIGVSGGEEGARHGPSLMPGGANQAWPAIKPIFQAIAAQVDGHSCCDWMGEGGAGHFVKMVHNGIEYGDMQLICEAYQILREGLGLGVEQLHAVFSAWNEDVLESYLIEITRDIFLAKDDDGSPLLDKILDTAGQKGTGKWTAINALSEGIPLTLIAESVFARFLSSLKQQRIKASGILAGPEEQIKIPDKNTAINQVRDALYASKIISYAQGFMLMQQASENFGWDLNFGNIAMVWRGGCIIRSRFLDNIKEAYEKQPHLDNLLMDQFFQQAITQTQSGWRKTIQLAVSLGIPTPALSSALAFYDGYRCQALPANLIQAQRDFFGAHTYERVDQPRHQFFHTRWSSMKDKTP